MNCDVGFVSSHCCFLAPFSIKFFPIASGANFVISLVFVLFQLMFLFFESYIA